MSILGREKKGRLIFEPQDPASLASRIIIQSAGLQRPAEACQWPASGPPVFPCRRWGRQWMASIAALCLLLLAITGVSSSRALPPCTDWDCAPAASSNAFDTVANRDHCGRRGQPCCEIQTAGTPAGGAIRGEGWRAAAAVGREHRTAPPPT